jgi:SHS2 domain-containing protein
VAPHEEFVVGMKNTKFEILEHTADIGFRARGITPADLFASAALALESIAIRAGHVEEREVYRLEASGAGYESLLVNFLSEVLYYLDGKRIVFRRFEFEHISPNEVRARGHGEPRDANRQPSRLVVKGVTYHQLEVREEEGSWVAVVFLDV